MVRSSAAPSETRQQRLFEFLTAVSDEFLPIGDARISAQANYVASVLDL